MLPEHVKIRSPELLYQAISDGFNIQNLYRVCSEYKREYKFSIMFIQTKNDKIFGCFIDDVFRLHLKGYLGSNECFVFSVKPEVHCFRDTNMNSRWLLGEMNYFQVGGEG